MKNCLDRVTAILSGLGAAIAVPASAATAGTATTAVAVGLPLLASLGTGALLYDSIKDRKKDDCQALMTSARKRVMNAWPYEDPTDRTEQAERDRLEIALAEVLPKCLPADEPALRALLAVKGLDGEKISEALLESALAHDSTFHEPGAKAFFRAVVTSAWTALRSEPNFYTTLQSHVDEAMFIQLYDIHHAVVEGFQITQGQISSLQASIDKLVAANESLSNEFGIKEEMLVSLAQCYAEGTPDNFYAALTGLRQALEVARDERQRGNLPSNTSDAVDKVIARIDALNDAGDLNAGQAALDTELASLDAEDEGRRAVRSRLYAKGITQAILTRDVKNACRFTVAQFELENPNSLACWHEDFKALFEEWYERGRDGELNFDLEVAIALAQDAIDRSDTPDQQVTAQNRLGTALFLLGERESGNSRLEQAIVAFEWTLEKGVTREQSPDDWATAQEDIGNALWALGQRENSASKLRRATAAYRLALDERPRKRVPLKWAQTQHNLGVALCTVGEQEDSKAKLKQAIAVFRQALEERTRKRIPLDWAQTQHNLGIALRALGQRERDITTLEKAVKVHEHCLKEWTRARVPLKWASAQEHLGIACLTIGERERGTARLQQAVDAYEQALEIYSPESAALQWAMTKNWLGVALRNLGERASDSDVDSKFFERARTSHKQALEMFRESNQTQYIEVTEHFLEAVRTSSTVSTLNTNFVREGRKTGRNDPCPCGSNRKFKQCCFKLSNIIQ